MAGAAAATAPLGPNGVALTAYFVRGSSTVENGFSSYDDEYRIVNIGWTFAALVRGQRMEFPALEILYEDNHCIAVAKPTNALTTHYQGKDETLDRAVKSYLKKKYAKPGKVFLGVVHRLDRPVSGVVLFARTSKAAARLSQQFRDGSVEKVYWAIVEGIPVTTAGSLEDWLLKDRERGRVEIVEPKTPSARQALLHYQLKESHGELSWLEIRPQTGRSHQLRVQLAHFGHPVYGDAKYGSIHTFGDEIALCARSLTFLHPIRYEPITLTAAVPRSWLRRFARLVHGKIPDLPVG